MSQSHTFEKMTERAALTPNSRRLLIVMVGLPGRGKSFISRKLARFLNWKNFTTRVFNVGQFRRDIAGPGAGESSFFDPNNTEAKDKREKAAVAALHAALDWMDQDNHQIAIFDATNSTQERRRLIYRIAKEHSKNIGILFIESLCDVSTWWFVFDNLCFLFCFVLFLFCFCLPYVLFCFCFGM